MRHIWEINKPYKVVGFSAMAQEKIVRRLLEFGFTPNEKFIISHKSLLSKSVIVELRGYSLSMRTQFLSYLQVE